MATEGPPSNKELFQQWLAKENIDYDRLPLEDKKRLYSTFKKDMDLDKTRALLQQQQQRYETGCQLHCSQTTAAINELAIDKDPDSVAFFYATLLSHRRLGAV